MEDDFKVTKSRSVVCMSNQMDHSKKIPLKGRHEFKPNKKKNFGAKIKGYNDRTYL